MVVRPTYSAWLRSRARGPEALERVQIAMSRLPNVLETNSVANLRTLEQKISDQGPEDQRVDPHLLRLALLEVVSTRKQIKEIKPSDSHVSWYANAGHDKKTVSVKLATLIPIYEKVAHGGFPNLIGDALEIVVFRCLQAAVSADPRCSFLGSIDYNGRTDKHGRFKKIDPPLHFMHGTAHGPVDFIFTHPNIGPLLVECKNVREWLYPDDGKIKELLRKSCSTGAVPLIVSRRIHYTTVTNLLEPAGIIAHQSYYQYYPDDDASLIAEVQNKRGLGFSDVRSWKNPHARTGRFFNSLLPDFGEEMAKRFRKNKAVLKEYADGDISRAELYRAIGSPASGFSNDDLPGYI